MLNIMLIDWVQRSPQSQPHPAHNATHDRSVFSDLKNTFKEFQSQSLEDCIELSLMLQYIMVCFVVVVVVFCQKIHYSHNYINYASIC